MSEHTYEHGIINSEAIDNETQEGDGNSKIPNPLPEEKTLPPNDVPDKENAHPKKGGKEDRQKSSTSRSKSLQKRKRRRTPSSSSSLSSSSSDLRSFYIICYDIWIILYNHFRYTDYSIYEIILQYILDYIK